MKEKKTFNQVNIPQRKQLLTQLFLQLFLAVFPRSLAFEEDVCCRWRRRAADRSERDAEPGRADDAIIDDRQPRLEAFDWTPFPYVPAVHDGRRLEP